MSLVRVLGVVLAVVGTVYLIEGALVWGLVLLLVGLFVLGGLRI